MWNRRSWSILLFSIVFLAGCGSTGNGISTTDAGTNVVGFTTANHANGLTQSSENSSASDALSNAPSLTKGNIPQSPIASTSEPSKSPSPQSSPPNKPVPKGKTIVIDAGHGGPDSGATGLGGVLEKNLTLTYAKAAQTELEARGYQVYLTRTADVACDPGATNVESEIRSRTALSAKVHATLYVSIHMNWFSNPAAQGTETFYNNTNHREGLENPFPKQSIRLAKALEVHVAGALHTDMRGTEDDELYNLITNTVPATLIEVGFISNQDDVNKLLSPDGPVTFARGFADGIDAYLAENK